MSDESAGLGQRAKSLMDRAKGSVGSGGAPLASEAGGRIEGMRDAFKAFGEGDIDRFMGAFDDEVEWSSPKGDRFPGAGNHQGRDAVREAYVEDAQRSYASFGFRPDRYLESVAENFVVAIGAFTGEGLKGTGQLDAPGVQVWGFDGDTVVSVAIYTDSSAFPGVVTEQEQKSEQESEQEEQDDDKDEKSEDRQAGKDNDDEPKGRKEEKDGDSDEQPEARQEHDGPDEDSAEEPRARQETRDGDDDGDDEPEARRESGT